MKTEIQFWDRWANRYSKKAIPDPSIYQEELRLTQSYFKPEFRLLELGCGTGTTALFHSPFIKYIQAIDFSKNMIAIARQKAKDKSITNIQFEQSAIENLNFEPETFDMIICLNVFHLLDDRDKLLGNIKKWLKNGGMLVLRTECLAQFSFLFKCLLKFAALIGVFPSLRYFSKADFIGLLKAHGFVLELENQPENASTVFVIAVKNEKAGS